MLHDFFILVDRNGLGFFLITLAILWAFERMVVAFINRNKPVCNCECCTFEHDDDDDEIVEKGGQVEEDE